MLTSYSTVARYLLQKYAAEELVTKKSAAINDLQQWNGQSP